MIIYWKSGSKPPICKTFNERTPQNNKIPNRCVTPSRLPFHEKKSAKPTSSHHRIERTESHWFVHQNPYWHDRENNSHAALNKTKNLSEERQRQPKENTNPPLKTT